MVRESSHRLAVLRGACALAAALALLAAGLTAASPARASPNLRSMIMDDDLLVYNTPAVRAFSLDLMKRLGVDGVRVTVSWRFLADDLARRPARLRGARAADPRSYRASLWARYDDLLRDAADRGMFVLLNPTGPGPRWAHPRAPRSHRFDQPAWEPNVAAFADFMKALGTRYSGSYRDSGGRLLPRASIWSIWNEPSQPASLAPQMDFSPVVGHDIPVAPILYRELYYAATASLRATGHGNDTILMGETAPLGAIRNTARVHLWPKLFLREMLCVAPNGRRYTGREAQARRCNELRRGGPLLVTGYAHHPYMQRNPPTLRDRDRDSVNLANLGDLPALLDRLADTTGLIPRGLPVWLTEAGWETLPPDPTRGISLALQAAYINQAERLAYDQPRVVADTQFIFRDVLPVARFRGNPRQLSQYWATWQSGLLFANGSPKPALAAYALPLDVLVAGPLTPDGGRDVRVWGELRFLSADQTAGVRLQFRYAGSTSWFDVGDPITVGNGTRFFDLRLHAPGPGVWRAVSDFGDNQLVSREVSVPF
jgi:hypothetical protein